MKGFMLTCSLLIAFNIVAATLDDVSFPDKATVAGKELILNGIGIRKATLFKIKVYYGALYLEQKTKDMNAFLKTNSPKQISMHFVRELDAGKIKDTWQEGFEKANKDWKKHQDSFKKLLSQVSDMKKDNEIIVQFHSDGVQLVINGQTKEKIPGAEFSQSVLNIWFINPLDENLKNGLLGGQ